MHVNCPDCNRKNKINIVNGKIKCRKCLQYIIIEDEKPLCCVPKVIFE